MYFWDDFLSSHMSREDLLADRTSLVHMYLMFVVYRTKDLKYNLFYLCVCVCMSVYVFLAVLQCIFHFIFVGIKPSYELSRSCSQNIYDTFTYTVR